MEPDPTICVERENPVYHSMYKGFFPVNVVGIWNQISLHVLKGDHGLCPLFGGCPLQMLSNICLVSLPLV